jgi:Ca-activated chloride channel family protein
VRTFPDRAELRIPALFLGHRTGANDVGQGRRGGGGGLFVELVAEEGAADRIGPGEPAFVVDARWIDAAEWEGVSERIEVENVLRPGVNPPSMWPFFSDPSRGKVFMMLNMYLALRTSVDFYERGDCGLSSGTVQMMEPSYRAWQLEYEDPDIDADWRLLRALDENVRKGCTADVVEPQFFHGSCMFI